MMYSILCAFGVIMERFVPHEELRIDISWIETKISNLKYLLPHISTSVLNESLRHICNSLKSILIKHVRIPFNFPNDSINLRFLKKKLLVDIG